MKNDEHLHKWVNGELTEAEEETFRQRPEYASLQRLWEYTERMQAPHLKEEDVVLSNILRTPKLKVRRLRRRRWLAAAATVGLLLLAWVWLQPPANTQITTAAGERAEEHLPDASLVILNAASTLEYNQYDWPENRQLELSGEAYFDVAKGSTFTVSTAVGQVKVLGTQFKVWSRENQLEVYCYEGRVGVQFAATGFDTVLMTGEAIRLQDGAPVKSWAIDQRTGGWQQQQIRLDGVPLARVVVELEHQFAIQVKTNNVDLTALLSTTFPADNLEQALRIIFGSLPVRYEMVSAEQVNLFQEAESDD